MELRLIEQGFLSNRFEFLNDNIRDYVQSFKLADAKCFIVDVKYYQKKFETQFEFELSS